MLTQQFIKLGKAAIFIDKHSETCIDGKPCDLNGDEVYEIEGVRVRERDFKQYRRFSPQYRRFLIMQDIQRSGLRLTSASCSCSKCGTVSIDEALWI